MRQVLWVVALAACGGNAPPPQPPSNQLPVATERQPAADPNALTKEVCAQRKDEFGPVPLRENQVALRRGTGVTKFAAIATTKETPIEVCMPGGQRAWIAGATCNDGSRPTSSARSGSVGPGGTCGSIIDLYIIACPEKEYEVFMDMYMCPPGEGNM